MSNKTMSCVDFLREGRGILEGAQSKIWIIFWEESCQDLSSNALELWVQIFTIIMVREAVLEILETKNDNEGMQWVYEICEGDADRLWRLALITLRQRNTKCVSYFVDRYATVIDVLLHIYEKNDMPCVRHIRPIDNQEALQYLDPSDYDDTEKRKDKSEEIVISLGILKPKIKSLDHKRNQKEMQLLWVHLIALHEELSSIFASILGRFFEELGNDNSDLDILMKFSAQLADDVYMNYIPFLDSLQAEWITKGVERMIECFSDLVMRLYWFTQEGERQEDIQKYFSGPFIEVNWSPCQQEVEV